ncbi:MAG: hypothetical protein J6Y79_00520 [Paludibacteraceae bacterium]|nr:hypothetical protein [Paludibacteraceae bacterium]
MKKTTESIGLLLSAILPKMSLRLLAGMLLTVPAGVAAQDLIIDHSGTRYTGRITSEDASNIVMQYEHNGETVDSTFSKNDIRELNYNVTLDPAQKGINDRNAFTFGLGAGGSSIVGVEYERLLFAHRYGIQIGGGLNGASFGLNVHFLPTIRSSYASVQYWYTGFGHRSNYWFGHRYMAVGPSVTWRAKKYFTATAGVGYVFDKGKALPDYADDFPIDVKLSIGIYLPF